MTLGLNAQRAMESWPGIGEAAAVGSWPATTHSHMAGMDIEIKFNVVMTAVRVVGDDGLDCIDVARAVNRGMPLPVLEG